MDFRAVAFISAVLCGSVALAAEPGPDRPLASPPTRARIALADCLTDTRTHATPSPVADQRDSRSDGSVSFKIRQSIAADSTLSPNARNVRVITHDGMVTLKGPVGSEREKRVVQQKASDVVGLRWVKSEIEVRL